MDTPMFAASLAEDQIGRWAEMAGSLPGGGVSWSPVRLAERLGRVTGREMWLVDDEYGTRYTASSSRLRLIEPWRYRWADGAKPEPPEDPQPPRRCA